MTTMNVALTRAAQAEISPRAQYGRIPPIDEVLKLRGDDLAYVAVRVMAARKAGAMCWACTRLLAAGTRCPDHPRARPPVMKCEVDDGSIFGAKARAAR